MAIDIYDPSVILKKYNEIISNNDLEIYRNKFSLDPMNYTMLDDKNINGEMYRIFYINIASSSSIWCDSNISTNRTDLIVAENHNINKQEYAFVTLFFPVHRNNKIVYDYLLTTCMVAYCLKNRVQSMINNSPTKANVVCMVTPDVEQNEINLLKHYYDDVVVVPYISWSDDIPENIRNDKNKFIRINDISKGNISGSNPWSSVMTKINLWNSNLFPYKKVVFVDSDCYPLRYYDTLFSYETPAGWLEHSRIKMQEFPVNSWAKDRCRFTNNIMGRILPDSTTNIRDFQSASDISAAIYVIKPDIKEYDDMIREITVDFDKYFGIGKKYDGYYIGNKKVDFYSLPEQNYLTQRYSGTWHSLSYGYESWLTDINISFGIHFAAFRIKPWTNQVINNKYTVNSMSLFNNVHITSDMSRSFGMKLFNQLLYRVLMDTKISNINIYNYFIKYLYENIKFYRVAFDTWEPEISLNDPNFYFTIDQLTDVELKSLSSDQLNIYYLLNQNTINNSLLSKKIIYDSYFENMYDPIFFAICYSIYESMKILIDNYNSVPGNEQIDIYAEGGTLFGTVRNNGFLTWDDDMDIGVLGNDENDGSDKIIKLINLAVDNNFVVACHFRRDQTKPFSLSNMITKMIFKKDLINFLPYCQIDCISLEDLPRLKNNICFFNVSVPKYLLDIILKRKGISLDYEYYSKRDIYEKVPWIDFLPYTKEIAKTNSISSYTNTQFIKGKGYYKYRRGGTKRQNDPLHLGISEDDILPLKQMTFINSIINVPNNPQIYGFNIYGDPKTNPNPLYNVLIFSRHGSGSTKRFTLPLEYDDIKDIDKIFNDNIKNISTKLGNIKNEVDFIINDIKNNIVIL